MSMKRRFPWETVLGVAAGAFGFVLLFGRRVQAQVLPASSRCRGNPFLWGRDYQPKLRRWAGENIGREVDRMTPQIFPGVPVAAIYGFIANSSGPTENTTEAVQGQAFHEIGLFGTEAGLRDGPAPNPDPNAPYNSWGRLASDPAVVSLLGRSATMEPDAWRRAIADQVAVGLVNVRRHGRSVSAALPAHLKPSSEHTLWFIALAFMGWSAGAQRAAQHVQRFGESLRGVSDHEKFGALIRAVRAGASTSAAKRSHANPIYSVLRTWQKLEAARQFSGGAAWLDLGLGDDSTELAEWFACNGDGRIA